MTKKLKALLKQLGTHLTEISARDIFFDRSKTSRKVEGTGFRLLPSTSNFELIKSEINPILMLVNIERRLENQMEFGKHGNKKRVRYAKYEIEKLKKLVNEPEEYGKLAQKLIKTSSTFQLMAFHDTFPRGYKEMPFSFVKNIARRVKRILSTTDTKLQFKRVNIPKKPEDEKKIEEYIKKGVTNIKEMSDVNFRPLGVPTHAGRVALKLHAWMLTLFLKDKIVENQHAYLPGKGTCTAGEDVLGKVKKYKYAYEIDLKQCFPSIQGEFVSMGLRKYGTPEEYVEFIEELNKSVPNPIVEDQKLKKTANEKLSWENPDLIAEKDRYDFMRAIMGEVNYNGSYNEMADDFDAGEEERLKGLPQGANTSPILTELVLDEWIRIMERKNHGTSVFYADDGIFFSNKPIKLEDDPARGIFIHPDKSGYVKYAGKGNKELKFLGVIYNGDKETLRADTRKGSKLEIANETGNILEILRDLKPEYSGDLENLFKFTSLGGIIMNRLYSGHGEKKEYPFEVSFAGIRESGLNLKGEKDNFKSTTSNAVEFLASGWDGEGEPVKSLNQSLRDTLRDLGEEKQSSTKKRRKTDETKTKSKKGGMGKK